ncbi:hypothetical protein GGI12_004765 [Dipsacomyces acuminosporus]|nr:hypothetical protein GGI12_004765 [Dipsacomyces acuminosporus]
MKGVAVITTALWALAVSVSSSPIDIIPDNTPQYIDSPLAIYVRFPGTEIGTVSFPSGKSTASSTAKPSSSAPSSTNNYSKPTSTIATTSSSSSQPSKAAEEPKPSPPSGDNNQSNKLPPSNGIPDGQGNSFKVPSGAIKFPWNYGNADHIVPITPQSENGGWAMSPNQQCKPGGWCPYACESGFYASQWDPDAKLYNGKGSMNGGLRVKEDGTLVKPFPDKPFCSPGMFNAEIENKLSQQVSACQTVYPGNEAMIIPTVAQPGGTAPLNVLPNTYWLGTSSQFYVNLAGSDASKCIWGDDTNPVGNWAPYIFGAGQGKDGNTYVSVQFNPLYIEKGFKVSAAYNVKIECTQGNCNFPQGGQCKCEGGKCSVDNGCTVTLPQSAKAKFVLY